jgi:hypothetical protein
MSGEAFRLPLTQGRMTSWDGGASRDIVAALNSELEQAQEIGRKP